MTRARARRRLAGARIPAAPPDRKRRLRLPSDMAGRRIMGGLLVLCLAFGGVVVRLVDVQVQDAARWAERGAAQRARTIELPPRRGRLYDREGDILATSVDAATVYADPRAYRPATGQDGRVIPPAGDAADVAARLAPLLGREPADLQELLERDAHFVYLGRQLDWELGQRIVALDLPGIGILTEPDRVYPGGDLAGQVVGFTDIDGVGLHGLEFQHDTVLRGRPGQLAVEQAPGGLSIASGVRQLVPPAAGTDLVLTIDRDIQHVAERAAADAVAQFSARGASVVVLEVGTGEILAMASAPTFDPDDRRTTDPAAFRNRAVTDVFEPGSVQKAITAAAALEEGVVTPQTTMLVPDHLQVGSKRFTDSHEHPTEEMTFARVIEESSNIGTIMVAQELGEQRLASYLQRFGFGQRLGVDFPGESPGIVPPVESWWNTSLPTISIGQGVAVTLLQAASFYATIGNDGVAVQPRILRGTVGEDGRLTPTDRGEAHPVVSPETAQALRRILADVVSGERGTGKAAAVPGYDVAGKTGTARKPRTDGRGYSDQYVASFVGLAPIENPRLVVAVMVDEPYPIYGGVVAAPVFREVMQFALLHRKVTPTRGSGTLEEAFATAEGQRQEAIEAAAVEGPGTSPDEPASQPVGTPVGGDGSPVASDDEGAASPSG